MLLRGFACVRFFSSNAAHSPPTVYKSVLKSLRKRLGQHLLKNPDVVKKIVDTANIQPHENVLEIGPGTGNMTIHMLEKAKAVLAVELDERMYETVNTRVTHAGLMHKFLCVRGDFLRTVLPPDIHVCVANIPYQISSPVLSKLLAYRPLLSRAVIMFQAEFAERMVAQPGSQQYCRLSVNTQLLSKVRHLMKVKRTQFRPPPKVDSIVVEIVPIEQAAVSHAEFKAWDAFLKLCFSGKNKTMRSLFGIKAMATRTQPETVVDPSQWRDALLACVESSGLSSHRANAMTLQEFLSLYRALLSAGAVFQPDDLSSDEETEPHTVVS